MKLTYVAIPALLLALINAPATAHDGGSAAQPTPLRVSMTSAAASAPPVQPSGAPAGPIIVPGAMNGRVPPIPPQAAEDMHSRMAVAQRFVQRLAAQQQAFRQRMIGALTPAHRDLFAEIVGELAIAPNPDSAAAARRLDAALSPAEAQTLIKMEQAKDTVWMGEMQQMASESNRTSAAPNGHCFMVAHPRPIAAEDAGSILLRTAAMGIMVPLIHVQN